MKPRSGRMGAQQGSGMGIYLDCLERTKMGQNYPLELRGVTPFLPCRGHGRVQGSSHTCRQEETAKISRWVEKGGEY